MALERPLRRFAHPHCQPPQTCGLLYLGAGNVANLFALSEKTAK
jgi:hypothetical protein